MCYLCCLLMLFLSGVCVFIVQVVCVIVICVVLRVLVFLCLFMLCVVYVCGCDVSVSGFFIFLRFRF